jgi:hypothetical protein
VRHFFLFAFPEMYKNCTGRLHYVVFQYSISVLLGFPRLSRSFRLDYVEIDLPPSTLPPIVYRRCTTALFFVSIFARRFLNGSTGSIVTVPNDIKIDCRPISRSRGASYDVLEPKFFFLP